MIATANKATSRVGAITTTLTLVTGLLLGSSSVRGQPAESLPSTPPIPQQGFMEGRLFQIALERAPEFSALGTPTFGVLATGQTQAIEQTLQAGYCYVWMAVGDTGQSDLDLAVSVGGERVAGDSALDDWPVANYCTAAEVAARVDVSMYSGSGSYGFNTYSRFFGGADLVEVNMNFHASTLLSEAVPQGPITRGTLVASAEQTFTVPLNGGRCYAILATAGPGVADIDTLLTDAAGQVVSSDEAPDNFPLVQVCPETNQNYTLRVSMYQGAGDFGWQVFALAP